MSGSCSAENGWTFWMLWISDYVLIHGCGDILVKSVYKGIYFSLKWLLPAFIKPNNECVSIFMDSLLYTVHHDTWLICRSKALIWAVSTDVLPGDYVYFWHRYQPRHKARVMQPILIQLDIDTGTEEMYAIRRLVFPKRRVFPAAFILMRQTEPFIHKSHLWLYNVQNKVALQMNGSAGHLKQNANEWKSTIMHTFTPLLFMLL